MEFKEKIRVVLNKCRAMNGPDNIFWIVPEVTAEFLYLQTKLAGAKIVLEIGTSIGYSTIYFAAATAANAIAANAAPSQGTYKIYTIDSHEERSNIAKAHISEAGLSDSVVQILGHAPDAIPTKDPVTGESLIGKIDILFLDATKKEYITCFEAAYLLLRPGAVIIADNVISHGEKMQDYIETMMNDPRVESTILNIGTGLILARKK